MLPIILIALISLSFSNISNAFLYLLYISCKTPHYNNLDQDYLTRFLFVELTAFYYPLYPPIYLEPLLFPLSILMAILVVIVFDPHYLLIRLQFLYIAFQPYKYLKLDLSVPL